jgi:hypothetical protein
MVPLPAGLGLLRSVIPLDGQTKFLSTGFGRKSEFHIAHIEGFSKIPQTGKTTTLASTTHVAALLYKIKPDNH